MRVCTFLVGKGTRRLNLSSFLLTATALTTRNFPVVSSLSFFPPPGTTDRSSSSSSTSTRTTENTPAAETAMKNVVTVGTEASVTTLGSKEFLLSNPSGAYTTARTTGGGSSIFEWEAHIERTASSLASMMEHDKAIDIDTDTDIDMDDFRRCFRLSDPAVLRQRLDASVEEAVRLHEQVNNGVDGGSGSGRELKITALVGWKESSTTTTATATPTANNGGNYRYEEWVSCHVTSLPALPTPPVRVEVRGSPRENASAKNSAWVSDRAPLEALMAAAEVAPINELLLTNARDEILEGSQTNFYAIIDGAVHTAGEGILEGTVRRLVLDVCRAEGIPVVLTPPSLNDVESWQGALLSSTSRLALPIDELYIPTEGQPSGKGDLKMTFSTGPDSIAARIQELVSREVEARSTPIGGKLVPR